MHCGRDDDPLREFASFTANHKPSSTIPTPASRISTPTGVYWIPLYELLDALGFTVLLVSAHRPAIAERRCAPAPTPMSGHGRPP